MAHPNSRCFSLVRKPLWSYLKSGWVILLTLRLSSFIFCNTSLRIAVCIFHVPLLARPFSPNLLAAVSFFLSFVLFSLSEVIFSRPEPEKAARRLVWSHKRRSQPLGLKGKMARSHPTIPFDSQPAYCRKCQVTALCRSMESRSQHSPRNMPGSAALQRRCIVQGRAVGTFSSSFFQSKDLPHFRVMRRGQGPRSSS